MSRYPRVAPLFAREDLGIERVALSGIVITRDDFGALVASPVGARLKVLELNGPPDFLEGGIETIAAHRERLRDVRVILAGGRMSAEALRAEGVHALSWHEAQKELAPLVPARW
ncbi:MAG: hypothetical protein J0L92_21560 [Deltaproteobacteria bacterium]|nr:hypothetical protein [Deltaproteobacteria bacterium]